MTEILNPEKLAIIEWSEMVSEVTGMRSEFQEAFATKPLVLADAQRYLAPGNFGCPELARNGPAGAA
jgi:hypothetical protein